MTDTESDFRHLFYNTIGQLTERLRTASADCNTSSKSEINYFVERIRDIVRIAMDVADKLEDLENGT